MPKGQKVVLVIGVLGLFLTDVGLLAHAEDIQKKQEKINVRLVWKRAYADKLIPDRKTFPPPEIQAEIESESTSEVGRRFLINALREQVAKHDRLVFFESGKIMDVKEEGYGFVYFSPNGEYIGFGSGKKGMTDDEFAQADPFAGLMSQLVLMTKEGEFLWRKTLVPNRVNMLESGEVALARCGEFPVSPCPLSKIYGRRGELILDFRNKQKSTLMADPKEKPIFPHWEKATKTLWLFAAEGKVVLRTSANEFSDPSTVFYTERVILSDDGDYVFLYGRKSGQRSPIPGIQFLMDKKGEIIRKFSFDHPKDFDFSPNGDFLAVIDNGKSLDFIESSTGRTLWQNPKKNKGNRLWSVAVSENGEFILLNGRLRAEKKWSGLLLSKKGEIIWRERLGLADVFIARDGSFFFIAAGDSLHCYAIDY